MNTTEDRLLALLRAELGLDASQLTLESCLDDLGDSLALVQVLLDVEEAFNVQLGEHLHRELDTAADLALVLAESVVA